MFLIKKLVAPLFFPLPLCLMILIAGLLFLWFTRRQRTGKILTTLGVALLVLSSYGAVPDLLLKGLEQQYPPLLVSAASGNPVRESSPPVKWVVVLGEGHTSDPSLPPGAQLSHVALARLVEGIRIYRGIPGAKLILSGGIGFDPVPQADELAAVAVSLGAPRDDLVLDRESKDTEDEARIIHSIVGADQFILVTSAWHMPRSMALFERLGMQPIPAPADQLVKQRQGFDPGIFYPNPVALVKMDYIIHERLGLIWSRIWGRV